MVVVHTGDVFNGGTTANVSMWLVGSSSNSGKLELCESCAVEQKGDLFDSGATDRFEVAISDLGQLQKMRIMTDDSGMFSSWFLERIEVWAIDRPKEQWSFTARRWLKKTDDETLPEIEVDVDPPNGGDL